MAHSFSPLRKAALSVGIVAASFAFVVGGGAAAYAEMDGGGRVTRQRAPGRESARRFLSAGCGPGD